MKLKGIIITLIAAIGFAFLGSKCWPFLMDLCLGVNPDFKLAARSMDFQFHQVLLFIVAFALLPMVVYLLVWIKQENKLRRIFLMFLVNLSAMLTGICLKWVLLSSVLDQFKTHSDPRIPGVNITLHAPFELLTFGTFALYGIGAGFVLSLLFFKRRTMEA